MIKVSISGPRGSGKTTVMVAIAKSLINIGHEVLLDEPNYGNKKHFDHLMQSEYSSMMHPIQITLKEEYGPST